MNQLLPCFIFVAWKSPSLSMTCVHEKRIIDPKIAITDMKRAFFSSLWIAFHGYMLCMTYWGPIRQWFSFEGSVVKFNSNENRASTQCIHKRAKAKEVFTFSRMCRQKSPLFSVRQISEFVLRLCLCLCRGCSHLLMLMLCLCYAYALLRTSLKPWSNGAW